MISIVPNNIIRTETTLKTTKKTKENTSVVTEIDLTGDITAIVKTHSFTKLGLNKEFLEEYQKENSNKIKNWKYKKWRIVLSRLRHLKFLLENVDEIVGGLTNIKIHTKGEDFYIQTTIDITGDITTILQSSRGKLDEQIIALHRSNLSIGTSNRKEIMKKSGVALKLLGCLLLSLPFVLLCCIRLMYGKVYVLFDKLYKKV